MRLITVIRSNQPGSLPHTGSLYMSQVLELEMRALCKFQFTGLQLKVSLDHNKVLNLF